MYTSRGNTEFTCTFEKSSYIFQSKGIHTHTYLTINQVNKFGMGVCAEIYASLSPTLEPRTTKWNKRRQNETKENKIKQKKINYHKYWKPEATN